MGSNKLSFSVFCAYSKDNLWFKTYRERYTANCWKLSGYPTY
jgi:hypothetical protein